MLYRQAGCRQREAVRSGVRILASSRASRTCVARSIRSALAASSPRPRLDMDRMMDVQMYTDVFRCT